MLIMPLPDRQGRQLQTHSSHCCITTIAYTILGSILRKLILYMPICCDDTFDNFHKLKQFNKHNQSPDKHLKFCLRSQAALTKTTTITN